MGPNRPAAGPNGPPGAPRQQKDDAGRGHPLAGIVVFAGPIPALAKLAAMLDQLRLLPGMVERQPGIFYRRSQSFLHFHEDPAGLFADLRLIAGEDFTRYQVDSTVQQATLVATVKAALAPTRTGA